MTLAGARAILLPLEARPALARADALAARLTAPAPVPAPVAALPFGLTAREAEVLRLVAEGLPDARIAARLFVGRSTVNTHLKAVLQARRQHPRRRRPRRPRRQRRR